MSTDPPTEGQAKGVPFGQGTELSFEGSVERHAAIEQAFHYRGDVTIHTVDGRVVQGYIFDRRAEGPRPYVRIIPADGTDRIQFDYDQIARLIVSGRDTAAGKSWQAWVKKYHEKRARNEPANIEPDPLD